MILYYGIQPPVNQSEPQRWYQRDQYSCRITNWQLGAVRDVSEDLKLATGAVVVVGMSGEFEQHDATQHMIAVP